MAVIAAPLGAAMAVGVALLGTRWRPPWCGPAGPGAGLLFGAGLALVTTVVSLPLSGARYAWGRDYGIVTQGVPGWALDLAKGLGIQMLITAGSAPASPW